MWFDLEKADGEEQPRPDEHPYVLMLRGDLGLPLRIYAVGGSLLLMFLCAMGIFAVAS
jgi:hypothetical protein